MQNMPIQNCQQYNPYMTPTDYSGVHIQIINPSVGVPGAAPVYNVNAPQYQTPSYPQNYYTNQWGNNGNGQTYAPQQGVAQPQPYGAQQQVTVQPDGSQQAGTSQNGYNQGTTSVMTNPNQTGDPQQAAMQPYGAQQQVTVQPNGMYPQTQTINGVTPIATNPYAANPYNNGFAEGYNAGYTSAVNAQKVANCPCCNGSNGSNGLNTNGVNNSTNNVNSTTTTTETKKTEKRNIIELTDSYIKNLENYLNSQDKEVRLMGAKEVVARLQEDDSRRDDRALTALVNKMLQDPYQPVRFLALAMLDTRACTGDDYSVAVLQNMQQGKTGYGQDALQASQILLKMSGQTVQKEFEVKEKPQQKENNK